MKRSHLVAAIFLFCVCGFMSACKKEYCVLPLTVNGSLEDFDCFLTTIVEDDTVRATTWKYGVSHFVSLVDIRFKKEVGVYNLGLDDYGVSAPRSTYFRVYIPYDDGSHTGHFYSLYGPGTSGTINITSINKLKRRIEGSFDGILCEKDSTERVHVSLESFVIKY